MPSTISERQYLIIHGLLQREYDNFINMFPGEEPFWKITCVRKHHRPTITEADRQMNWRQFTKVGGQVKVEEIKTVSVKKRKFTDRVTKQQERKKKFENNVEVSDRPIRRAEKYVETIEEDYTIEVFDSNVNAVQVDVHSHVSDASLISIVKLDTIKQSITEEVFQIWDTIKGSGVFIDDDKTEFLSVEDKIRLVSDRTIKVINEQQQMIHDLKNEISLLKAQLDQNKLIEIKELSHIKQDWSVNEIINKYVDIQKKLTMVKSKIMPILEKHDRLGIHKKIADKGFITSLISVVEYFDDEYDEEDHLSDFD